MGSRFRDSEHLFRMVGLYVLGTLALLLLRSFVVPSDFGLYGHFRAGALDDNRAVEMRYAGREVCEACHDDVAEARAGGAHERVGCESCHGPLAAHAADPGAEAIVPPSLEHLCASCHQRNASKPKSFPQVDAEEHAAGMPCSECHEPHRPDFE